MKVPHSLIFLKILKQIIKKLKLEKRKVLSYKKLRFSKWQLEQKLWFLKMQ